MVMSPLKQSWLKVEGLEIYCETNCDKEFVEQHPLGQPLGSIPITWVGQWGNEAEVSRRRSGGFNCNHGLSQYGELLS